MYSLIGQPFWRRSDSPPDDAGKSPNVWTTFSAADVRKQPETPSSWPQIEKCSIKIVRLVKTVDFYIKFILI
jgi:hypothetical protein